MPYDNESNVLHLGRRRFLLLGFHLGSEVVVDQVLECEQLRFRELRRGMQRSSRATMTRWRPIGTNLGCL